MINVNILNDLIKGIAKQIPLVNSYYTQSPYESWNVSEVQYGSVSFVVTKVNTTESTTTYDATIYYADRLVEDNSNRDSVHSDAATVIQTIVGALNTADEYLEVSYPVGITLFEQDFADKLAGGYAQLSISAVGMGECFEDEFSVPEIIATSAYFSKDEIMELFPLKTELAKVAYTGSFSDLENVPEFASKSEFDAVVRGQNQINTNLAVELKNKVSNQYFQEQITALNTAIDGKIGRQTFDNYAESVNQVVVNLATQVATKLDADYFDGWKQIIQNDVDSKVSRQSFDNALENIYTKNEVNEIIGGKLDDAVNDYVETGAIENIVNDVINETIENITEDVTESVRTEIDSIVEEEIQNQLGEYVTQDDLDDAVAEQYENFINTDEFQDTVQDMVNGVVNNVVGDLVTENELAAKNYASKYYVDSAIANVSVDLSDYYTKSQIDDIIDNIDVGGGGTIDLSNYPTKSEVESTYLTKTSANNTYLTKTSASNTYITLSAASSTYLTKTSANNTYLKKDDAATSFYTKSQIDDIIDNIDVGGGGTVDLSDYYKKSETYSKTQIDSIVGDINTILNDVLYNR